MGRAWCPPRSRVQAAYRREMQSGCCTIMHFRRAGFPVAVWRMAAEKNLRSPRAPGRVRFFPRCDGRDARRVQPRPLSLSISHAAAPSAVRHVAIPMARLGLRTRAAACLCGGATSGVGRRSAMRAAGNGGCAARLDRAASTRRLRRDRGERPTTVLPHRMGPSRGPVRRGEEGESNPWAARPR